MVQVRLDNEHDKMIEWIVRLVLLGWFLLELSVIAYVIQLTVTT